MRTMIAFMKHIGKMPAPWRIWVMVLAAVNLGSVVFLDHLEARVVLGAMMIGGLAQGVVFARKGFVRLLGIGHFHWFPMLFWIFTRLEGIRADPTFFYWIVALAVVDGLSLLIDVTDVARYVLGDREPQIVAS